MAAQGLSNEMQVDLETPVSLSALPATFIFKYLQSKFNRRMEWYEYPLCGRV